MSLHFSSGFFLAGFLLLPGFTLAQTTTERTTESVEIAPSVRSSGGKVPDLSAAKREILTLTNRFRAQHKLEGLKSNDKLAKAAQAYAEYLADNDKFSHTADGKEPWQRVKERGYTYCIVLE